MTTSLEQTIRAHVPFVKRPNGKGWLSVLCRVCNDHGQKGLRGAFLFTPTSVSYNCFNCGHKAVYDETVPEELSKKMITVLHAFSIPEEEIQQITFEILQRLNNTGIRTRAQKQHNPQFDVKPIEMPSCCIPLNQVPSDNKWKQIAELYLEGIRGIDPRSYPFYLGMKESNDPKSSMWYRRLVIPSYKNGNLVYFEGRDLTGKNPKKYLSAEVPKSNVLYGFDQLYNNKDTPLFVVEGFFDAFMIEGVAVFGNHLYKETIHHLKSSPRPKVIIPDKYGNGYKLAEQALSMGWQISTPEIAECKDINEAVQKYGKLYVVKSIMDNISSDFAAETRLRFYCKEYGKGK